jgi:hypothetical protein
MLERLVIMTRAKVASHQLAWFARGSEPVDGSQLLAIKSHSQGLTVITR